MDLKNKVHFKLMGSKFAYYNNFTIKFSISWDLIFDVQMLE